MAATIMATEQPRRNHAETARRPGGPGNAPLSRMAVAEDRNAGPQADTVQVLTLTAGLKLKGKTDHIAVDAEDALLIAALKVKD